MISFSQLLVVTISLIIGAAQAGLLKALEQAKPIFDKRAWCYIDIYGYQITCSAAYKCCAGTVWSTCILSNMVCCDFGSSVGGCPVGSTCGYDYYRNPACIRDGMTTVVSVETTTTTRPVTSPTTTTTDTSTTTSSSRTSSSSSTTPTPNASPQTVPQNPSTSSSGLSKGATIGIAISITCSVLGLIIGVGIKWYFHSKAAKNGQVG